MYYDCLSIRYTSNPSPNALTPIHPAQFWSISNYSTLSYSMQLTCFYVFSMSNDISALCQNAIYTKQMRKPHPFLFMYTDNL